MCDHAHPIAEDGSLTWTSAGVPNEQANSARSTDDGELPVRSDQGTRCLPERSEGRANAMRSSLPPAALLGLATCLVAGCAATTGTANLPRSPSYALATPAGAPLVEVLSPAGEGGSFFAPIDHGADGLDVRLALAANATSSIDVQSYLWHPDASGMLLLDSILVAADRGVRTRLLIDGFKLERNRDLAAAIGLHPHVEVRIFNPELHRGGIWGAVELLENMGRLDHRMHDKVFLVDGVAAVFGGRNIGDEYFGLGDDLNMRDFDALATGPVVDELAASFDEFWNSDWAIPLEDLATPGSQGADAHRRVRAQITARHAADPRLDERRALEAGAWAAALRRARRRMVEGRAHVLRDTANVDERGAAGVMARAFEQALASSHGDVLLVAAYLVPDAELLDRIRAHTAAGERVRILTNSYRSTNQPLAHTYYAGSRRALLEAGAELYELRPDAWSHVHHRIPASRAELLCLHAKSAVFGRDQVVVGSMNLDPRSMVLNTELGVLIESEAFASSVRAALERELADRNAWHVTLDEDGEMRWTSQGVEHTADPDMPTSEAIREWFVRLLPLRGEV